MLQAHGAYGATYGGAFVMSVGRAWEGQVWNEGLSEEAYGTSAFGGEREVNWLSELEKWEHLYLSYRNNKTNV